MPELSLGVLDNVYRVALGFRRSVSYPFSGVFFLSWPVGSCCGSGGCVWYRRLVWRSSGLDLCRGAAHLLLGEGDLWWVIYVFLALPGVSWGILGVPRLAGDWLWVSLCFRWARCRSA